MVERRYHEQRWLLSWCLSCGTSTSACGCSARQEAVETNYVDFLDGRRHIEECEDCQEIDEREVTQEVLSDGVICPLFFL